MNVSNLVELRFYIFFSLLFIITLGSKGSIFIIDFLMTFTYFFIKTNFFGFLVYLLFFPLINFFKSFPKRKKNLPTSEVKKGTFLLKSFLIY